MDIAILKLTHADVFPNAEYSLYPPYSAVLALPDAPVIRINNNKNKKNTLHMNIKTTNNYAQSVSNQRDKEVY